MRELKFRAFGHHEYTSDDWDSDSYPTDEKSMIFFGLINGLDEHHHDTGSLEKMQYTGRKDINKIDIYECDIVSWRGFDDSKVEIGVIEWDEEYAGFGITGDHCLDWSHAIEVVGNIHENPELLTENKK